MTERCLFDTSALSDVIQPAHRRRPSVDRRLTEYLSEHGKLTFSHISCFEILRGLRQKHASAQIHRFAVFCAHSFCAHSELLPGTYEVLDRAAELWAAGRQSGVSVDDSDLIISATRLLADLSIVTANPRHFAWITGLRTSNWREP